MNILKFLEAICESENIFLDSLGGIERLGGVALNLSQGNIKAIAYSDKLEGWHMASVIAHEIGNHILGHLSAENPDKERRERESQVFAAAFTAFAMYDYHKSRLSLC
jgi:hypothetical protein